MGVLLQQSVDRKGPEIDLHNRAVKGKYHQHSDGKIKPLVSSITNFRSGQQSRKHSSREDMKISDLRYQTTSTLMGQGARAEIGMDRLAAQHEIMRKAPTEQSTTLQ
jgi:hypothetical protein